MTDIDRLKGFHWDVADRLFSVIYYDVVSIIIDRGTVGTDE